MGDVAPGSLVAWHRKLETHKQAQAMTLAIATTHRAAFITYCAVPE